jgi:hypothetical protein
VYWNIALRIFNRFIITLAVTLGLLNTSLALLEQDDISIYFITDAVAYLVITLLFVYLNPRAKNALNGISTVIFVGFLVVVALKLINLLK